VYTEIMPVEDVRPKHYPEEWGVTRGMDSRQEGAGAADQLLHFETLRVELINEEGGRITVSSPQLDIASFGNTELEAWEAFVDALADLTDFYFENRKTLSPPLRKKLQILESLYVVQME
jgi:hypothetical protein